MQTVELEIQDDKMQTFLTIVESLKNDIVSKISFEKKLESDIASKKNSFTEFAGLWEDRDIDTKTLRESAWKK